MAIISMFKVLHLLASIFYLGVEKEYGCLCLCLSPQPNPTVICVHVQLVHRCQFCVKKQSRERTATDVSGDA